MSSDELLGVGMWPPVSEELVEPDGSPLPSSRVPHIGHALIFLAMTGFLLVATQGVLVLPNLPHNASPIVAGQEHPKLLLGAEALTYVLTLLISWFLFPLMWKRSFGAGIQWNAGKAVRLAPKLVPMGLVAGWTIQGLSNLIQMPKTVPMDNFFRSASDVWLVTLFGTLLAPLFEEICFRGFLLPAFTIAFDWLGPVLRYVFAFSLCRLRGEVPPEHLVVFAEDRSAGLVEGTGNLAFRSLPALILASLVSSALFGLLHAQQLGYTWIAVLMLTAVSLILTGVRIKTRSVACSALTHGSYNLSIFLALFVATGGYRHLDRVIH